MYVVVESLYEDFDTEITRKTEKSKAQKQGLRNV